MIEENANKDFEILGEKITVDPSKISEMFKDIEAQAVIEVVASEVEKHRARAPHLDKTKVAILVALKLAADKLVLEKEYKKNISKLENTAKDALNLIEEVSPATI